MARIFYKHRSLSEDFLQTPFSVPHFLRSLVCWLTDDLPARTSPLAEWHGKPCENKLTESLSARGPKRIKQSKLINT